MNTTHLTVASVVMFGVFAASAVFAADDAAAGKREGKLLYHVVCFKYKEDASKEKIAQVEKGIKGLKDKIPGIRGVTYGTNNSPEKLDKGFTHAFIVAFESEKARDDYLPHPEHKAVVEVIKQVVADVFGIDVWGDAPRESRRFHGHRAGDPGRRSGRFAPGPPPRRVGRVGA